MWFFLHFTVVSSHSCVNHCSACVLKGTLCSSLVWSLCGCPSALGALAAWAALLPVGPLSPGSPLCLPRSLFLEHGWTHSSSSPHSMRPLGSLRFTDQCLYRCSFVYLPDILLVRVEGRFGACSSPSWLEVEVTYLLPAGLLGGVVSL